MQDVYHGCDGSRLSFYHRIRVFVYHGLRLSFFISIYSTMPLESSLILLLATKSPLSLVSTPIMYLSMSTAQSILFRMVNEDEVDVVRQKDTLKRTCVFIKLHSGRRRSTKCCTTSLERAAPIRSTPLMNS